MKAPELNENVITFQPLTSAQDLIDRQWQTIHRLTNNEITPAVANGITNSTSSILRVLKFQMDYAKMTGKTPEIPLLLTGGNGKK